MEAEDAGNSAETFRSLCRSSPWRWTALRFDVFWQNGKLPDDDGADAGPDPAAGAEPAAVDTPPGGIRAWLRRPEALRVESPDGELLFCTTSIHASRGDLYVSATRKSWLLPPRLVTPVYDHIGLVRRRPEAAYGEPFFEDPRFASMLDPVEFAGKAPVSFDTPFANLVEITSISQVEHEGRRALEAVLSPNHTYRPTAPGSPLIGAGSTAVRVDWETGVCVSTLALDGPLAGSGHSVRILGVDEYMLDELFVEDSVELTDVRAHIPWEVS